MDEQKKNSLTAEADGIIEGRNAVIEALRAGEHIDKIYLQKGETDKTLGHIASKARAAGIVVVEADRRKLDNMSCTHAHQGQNTAPTAVVFSALILFGIVLTHVWNSFQRGEAWKIKKYRTFKINWKYITDGKFLQEGGMDFS